MKRGYKMGWKLVAMIIIIIVNILCFVKWFIWLVTSQSIQYIQPFISLNLLRIEKIRQIDSIGGRERGMVAYKCVLYHSELAEMK